jgi:hypothetical protein
MQRYSQFKQKSYIKLNILIFVTITIHQTLNKSAFHTIHIGCKLCTIIIIIIICDAQKSCCHESERTIK